MKIDAIAIDAIAKVFGLEKENTGGGCMALVRWYPGDIHIIVTDGEAGGIPDNGQYAIGIYDGDCQPISSSQGQGAIAFARALASAIEKAESLIPSTDAMADELEQWCKANGYEPQCAEQLRHKLLQDGSWLEDFIRRYRAIESFEDMTQAAINRGDI